MACGGRHKTGEKEEKEKERGGRKKKGLWWIFLGKPGEKKRETVSVEAWGEERFEERLRYESLVPSSCILPHSHGF